MLAQPVALALEPELTPSWLQERASSAQHRHFDLSTMVRCCVPDCENDSRDKKGWSFFHFPLKNEALLRIWLRKISRLDFVPGPESRICSEHFDANCFEQGVLSEELLQAAGIGSYRKRRKLKADAVPTIFPARRSQVRPRRSQHLAKKDHKEVRR